MQQLFSFAMKKTFWFRLCVRDVISGVGFRPFSPWLLDPGPQTQEGSTSLMILAEAMLKSKFFEHLISFLGFLVQKFG